MKKIIFLFTAAIFAFSVNGQNLLKGLSLEEIEAQISKRQTFFGDGFVETDAQSIREFNYSDGQVLNNTLKSSLDNTQQLDSTITETWDSNTSQWVVSAKTEYSRYENGLTQERIDYTLDAQNNLWLLSAKTEYAYDVNGNTILYLNYNWDKENEKWIPYSEWIYQYDNVGNIILKEVNWWPNGDNVLVGFSKYEVSYNSAGQRILYIRYTWSSAQAQWINNIKEDWDFNTNGDSQEYYYFVWDSNLNDWIGQKKSEYIYNVNALLSQTKEYLWNNDLNNWSWQKRNDYVYNTSGNLVQTKAYTWDLESTDWMYSGFTNYTYDNKGNILSRKGYVWDNTKQMFSIDLDEEFSWDSNGNMTKEINYRLSGVNERFAFGMIEKAYDTQGRLTYDRHRSWGWNDILNVVQLEHDFFYEDTFDNEGRNIVHSFMSWHYSGEWTGNKSEITYNVDGNRVQVINYAWSASLNQWNLDDRFTYYYSNHTISSISDFGSIDKVYIYPNPATNYMVFDIDINSNPALVELYDILGKKVLSQVLKESKQISISQLKSGIYFYKLIQAQETFSGKIIIK